MKKLTAILLAALLACLMLAGCAAPAENKDSDLAYLKEKGTMVIGITIYEPMNYYDADNKLIGFDTEYAEAVCEKLGLEPEFQVINWDTKEIELKSKTIDAIWNGLTINDERRENMDFTDPYVKNMQVCVIKAENADLYKDTASMKDAKLVAEISSAGAGAIAADENLKQGEYTDVNTQADALFEVKAGTADVAVIDYVMAKAMVGEGTDYADLMIVDGVELSVEEYGIGLRLGSDVTKAINDATAELIKDGTLVKIAEKYDMAASLVANQK